MAFPYVLVSKFMSRNSFESCQGVANVMVKKKISNAGGGARGSVAFETCFKGSHQELFTSSNTRSLGKHENNVNIIEEYLIKTEISLIKLVKICCGNLLPNKTNFRSFLLS